MSVAGMKVGLVALVLGGLALVGSSTASAATIKVNPQNGRTIQQGVDLADPGDTVAVTAKRKAYFENVVVTTPRITIRGIKRKGRPVVVDGTSFDGDTDGLTFDIDANRVTLANLSSRHGNAIDCTGDNCAFRRIQASMSDQTFADCIEIDGNAGSVRKSNFIGCDDGSVS